ncbi:MAG TPA: metallopeptidase family protein [Candidatus Dormibacteraeota bacterium]|jgi:predicted Zn-dependent protease with MMP-like domain|nr:metallopeptidase family protein [Candidatus Dormibacteraeota bacterium]
MGFLDRLLDRQPPPRDDESAARFLSEAEAAFREGDVNHAVQLARDAERSQHLPPQLEVRALLIQSRGLRVTADRSRPQRLRALRSAERADALDPGSFMVALELGMSCFELADMERAEACFRRCVRLEPRSARVWGMLARVLPYLDRLAEGDACAATAAQLDPYHHAVPYRVDADAFHALAVVEWQDIPATYQEALGDTDVVIHELPGREMIEHGFVTPTTLGVYSGGGRPRTGPYAETSWLEQIILFQRIIESYSRTPAELHHQVRITLRHEIGHNLGLDHAALHEMGLD